MHHDTSQTKSKNRQQASHKKQPKRVHAINSLLKLLLLFHDNMDRTNAFSIQILFSVI